MKKKWLLLCSLVISVMLCACQAKENTSDKDNLPPTVTQSVTQTPMPTATPTPVPEYMLQSENKETEQQLVSLIEDKECTNVVCYENDNIVSAIVSERKMEIASDNTVNGEETFYVVVFDKKKEETLLLEKKVAEHGFQAAFMQHQNKMYVSVISRNDYCGVEYYDMCVYRIEDGQVSAGKIAEDADTIQWWQDYKPVLTNDGVVELYVRKTETENFTNELMKEMELLEWFEVETIKTEAENYAEKFAYSWEYAYSVSITELDYVKEQRILTQSQVYSDIVEKCFKPDYTEPSEDGDKLCGIICSTVGKEDGYQLIACKRLGSSRAQGIGHVAIMLYDKQGMLVDFDYYIADDVSIDCKDSEIYVFARCNQQGWVETVIDSIVYEENGKISYR